MSVINKNNKDIKNKLDREIQKIISKKNNLLSDSSIKDLSHLKTYTIDDIDTIEIDDAISLEKISNNYKLWIHIASPAANTDYNSLVDKRARELISTLYLTTNNIYMLPKTLINEIFSLTKKEKRPSLSLGVIFNNDGSVYKYEVVQSLIRPNYQLSYDEADELIDYAPNEEKDLSIISNILEKRKCWRMKLGAKEVLESYGKIIVNDNIPSIKIIDQTLSRLLISEAMILYGHLLANYTYNNKITVPYRVQENISSHIEKNIFSDNRILYNFLLKKSLGKTYYSSISMRHIGLGLNYYIHATSPIRRYSDLLVHYQVKRFLDKKEPIAKEDIEKNIKMINILGRQNSSKYREDQKFWKNKWFKNNSFIEYKVIFLDWINRYNNICIIYFVDYYFSSICYLKTKLEIKVGEEISIENITNDYKDLLYFKLK